MAILCKKAVFFIFLVAKTQTFGSHGNFEAKKTHHLEKLNGDVSFFFGFFA